MDERVVSGHFQEEEKRMEVSLRPSSFDEYVGQHQVKENLKIYIEAAKGRGDVLDHVIFYGPPGLGKTTMANIIAHEMGVNIKSTSGPAIEKPGDLAAILSNLSEGDIFFIDEIHRLHPTVEEVLYPAMEDYQIDLIIGQGPSARTLKLAVPRFTLIGATTRAGLLTSPLRDRFGIINRLEFYTPKELCQIVLRSAGILNASMENPAALEIATRSRGTPRIANRILRRVRDFAQVKSNGSIDLPTTLQALLQMGIDTAGLDQMDQKLLLLIIDKFGGGPVGLETLASALGEEKETLEDVIEPFLLQSGYIDRTARGRMATAQSFAHFGKPYGHAAPGKTASSRLF